MKKADRFVLDANTLISAFLLSNTTIAARSYYKALELGEIVLSEDTLNEFSDVFIREKFDRYLSLNKRLTIIEDLKNLLSLVPVTKQIKVCRDPKDDKYLELAVSANAKCIITGDKDLLVLNPFESIPILTPASFLEKI